MKLYNSIGPNPHIVRMFMAEKGIDMPKQTVDLRGGENRAGRASQAQSARARCRRSNSTTAAICRRSPRSANISRRRIPQPALIGSTPEQRAECRMWTRRVDLNICEPLANGYRFGEALKFFEKRIPVRAGSLPRPEDDRRKTACNG